MSGTREALFAFMYLQEMAAWDRLPSISAVKLHRLAMGSSPRWWLSLSALREQLASTFDLLIHKVAQADDNNNR